MKIYSVRLHPPATYTAEIPDGTLVLDIGATVGPDGRDHAPIVMIDRDRGRYRREGGDSTPIPAGAIRARDLKWTLQEGTP